MARPAGPSWQLSLALCTLQKRPGRCTNSAEDVHNKNVVSYRRRAAELCGVHVQVLCEIAKGAEKLADVALQHTQIEQGMAASQRVAYALTQLAGSLENHETVPAQGHSPEARCTSQMRSGHPCSNQPVQEVQHEAGDKPSIASHQEERHSQKKGDQQQSAGVEQFCRATAILHGVAGQIMSMQRIHETLMPRGSD
jgi:hypothetical protein